jgi:hypothetical protein
MKGGPPHIRTSPPVAQRLADARRPDRGEQRQDDVPNVTQMSARFA